MNPHRLRAYILMLLVAAIWGVASPVIKFTLGGINPLPFLSYRFFISTIVAVIFFAIFGIKIPNLKKNFPMIFIYCFLTSTGALGLLFWGMDKTTSLEAAFISTINPLIIMLSGYIFLKERVTARERLGALIALIGTITITIEPLINNGGGNIKFSGNLLIIGYVLANATSIILLKKLLRQGAGAFDLSNASFLVGFLTILPLTLILSGTGELWAIKDLAPQYHLGVFYMALISGTLAYALGNIGQRTIEVSEASLFYYLTPIFTMPLSVLWLKEKITFPFIIGAIIIAIGVTIAEIKKKRYN